MTKKIRRTSAGVPFAVDWMERLGTLSRGSEGKRTSGDSNSGSSNDVPLTRNSGRRSNPFPVDGSFVSAHPNPATVTFSFDTSTMQITDSQNLELTWTNTYRPYEGYFYPEPLPIRRWPENIEVEARDRTHETIVRNTLTGREHVLTDEFLATVVDVETALDEAVLRVL